VDVSAFLIIPLAAIVAAAVMVAAYWFTAVRERSFIVSFAVSFLLSVVILGPWDGMAVDEWQFLVPYLGLTALWVAGGTVVGMALGLLLVKVARLVAGTRRR
jgi:hypothetical protein